MNKKLSAIFPIILLIILALAVVISIAIPIDGLIINGIFKDILDIEENIIMFIEITILMFLLLFIGLAVKNIKLRIVCWTLVGLTFIYIHYMLITLIITGIYICYLYKLGKIVNNVVCRRINLKNSKTINLQAGTKQLYDEQIYNNQYVNLIIGISSMIILVCAMSAFNLGSVQNVRIVTIMLAIPVLGTLVKEKAIIKKLGKNSKSKMKKNIKKALQLSKLEIIMLCTIMLLIFIQAGRLNIAIDHDTAWYGVRSNYILSNSKGIYENLGNVSLVYTYSKGLEILVLPLAGLPSHGFVTAVNLWFLIIALHCCYKIARNFVPKNYALFACVLITSISGVTNMAITAKSDILTLLMQLFIIYFVIEYFNYQKPASLIHALCAFLISWTLKPTALVFSTAIFGMAGLYFIVKKQLYFREYIGIWGRSLISLAALIMVWARTYILTGLPVTSVFSGTLIKLGFEMKYPYASKTVTNYNPSIFSLDGLKYMKDCFYGLFFLPDPVDAEKRMVHVVIAWGTILVPIMLLILIICIKQVNIVNIKTKALRWLMLVMYLPFTILCFISVITLWQIDGNYFMLWYVMTVIWVVPVIYNVYKPTLRRGILVLLVPVIMFNILITSQTNWAWQRGFTPIDIKNRGYYNHIAIEQQAKAELGNVEIWKKLAKRKETRVIAMGFHQQVLTLPCNVQSYYDVWTWGNIRIIDTKETFKDYMRYAGTEYLYVEGGFVDDNSIYTRMIKDLMEDGTLTDIFYENGNMLAKIRLEGGESADYFEFMEKYNFYIE